MDGEDDDVGGRRKKDESWLQWKTFARFAFGTTSTLAFFQHRVHPVRRQCSSNVKFQVLLWIICPEHSSTHLPDLNLFEAAVALYDTSFTVWLICSHLEHQQSWRLPTTLSEIVRSVSGGRALGRIYD